MSKNVLLSFDESEHDSLFEAKEKLGYTWKQVVYAGCKMSVPDRKR